MPVVDPAAHARWRTRANVALGIATTVGGFLAVMIAGYGGWEPRMAPFLAAVIVLAGTAAICHIRARHYTPQT